MTLAFTLYLKQQGEPLPGKLVVISPVTDLEDTFPSRIQRDERDPMILPSVGRDMLRHYYNGKEPRNPLHSVRYADYAGFPDTYIGVSSEEVLYDDSVDLKETLDKSRVKNVFKEYKGLFHTFQTIPSSDSKKALSDMAKFLNASMI